MVSSVSIIMPAFNCQNFISKSILSVIGQTHKNWELIIVDDRSTDDTVHVINDLAKTDKRICLITNDKNEGAAVCRNKAIKYANGKYVAFLDSDDLWNFDKLEIQIKYMEMHDLPFTYSAYEVIDEGGHSSNILIEPPAKLSFDDMLKENQIGCLTAIYDQNILSKQFMPLIRKRQDYGLWLDILKITPYAQRVPGVLAKYRMRKGSVSDGKLNLLYYNFQLFNKYQKFSVVKSLYYVAWNIYRKIKK
jgi:teichuronic acid biosynthesis glycosyltransferase TuaG